MFWTTRMTAVLALVVAMALACAGVGVWSYRTGRASGEAAVRAQWMAERAEIARATAAALERRIEAEAKLRETIDATRHTYRQQLAAVAADRDRLLDSLRHRPERPAGGADLPGAAGARLGATACTGAELYREDAAFLVGLAAEADQLRAAVERCQAAYDAVRDSLVGTTQKSRIDESSR